MHLSCVPSHSFQVKNPMFILSPSLLKSIAAALFALAWSASAVLAQWATAPIKLAMIEGLSGLTDNAGEAVYRNPVRAEVRVNAPGGNPMVLERFDSKGQTDEVLFALRSAVDGGARFMAQGNSSASAAALIDAINKHNEREPTKPVMLLNYSAVDPMLTNEKCSFWHFRFDAHADLRMAALMDVLRDDKSVNPDRGR